MDLRISELIQGVVRHFVRGRYLSLLLFTRVLPILALMVSAQMLLKNLEDSYSLLDSRQHVTPHFPTFADVLAGRTEYVTGRDLQRQHATNAIRINGNMLTYARLATADESQTGAENHIYSASKILQEGPTDILVWLLITSVLMVLTIIGRKYFTAYVLVDVYGRELEQRWTPQAIHRLTRRTNMWLLLIPTSLSIGVWVMVSLVPKSEPDLTDPFAIMRSTPVLLMLLYTLVSTGVTLWLTYRFLFWSQAMLLEDYSPLRALGRTFRITRRRAFRLLIITLIFASPVICVNIILYFAGVRDKGLIPQFTQWDNPLVFFAAGGWPAVLWVGWVLMLLISLAVTAIAPVLETILFLQCRTEFEREEAASIPWSELEEQSDV